MIVKVCLFLFITAIFIFLCYRQLLNVRCHGFYRFFAFEALLVLAIVNLNFNDIEWFGKKSIVSGFFLLASFVMVVYSLKQLKKAKIIKRENSPENFCFENTAKLITEGVYYYIRHPMYTSLLLLGFGLFLHNPSVISLSIFLLAGFFIWLTAWVEEKENILFFGDQYKDYKVSSKMLVPFIM